MVEMTTKLEVKVLPETLAELLKSDNEMLTDILTSYGWAEGGFL